MLGRREIDVTSAVAMGLQLVSTSSKEPAVAWLRMSGQASWGITDLAVEPLRNSGPYRLEYHTGRVDPAGPTTPDVLSLILSVTSWSAQWSSTDGWQQGTGVWCKGYAQEDVEGTTEDDYRTLILWPTGTRIAGAGLRIYPDASG